MIDIFDLIHYLIGLLIVGLLVWSLIKMHQYFSKDNITIFMESYENKKD